MINLFVLALLCIDDKILFVRRFNTNFGSGLYSLIGGKVEAGETALCAIKRETFEEVGLDIDESQFGLVHVLHRKGTETEFIALCFKADISGMSPYNKELTKHDDMQYFNTKNLLENIIPAHKQIIDCVEKNILYSQHGW